MPAIAKKNKPDRPNAAAKKSKSISKTNISAAKKPSSKHAYNPIKSNRGVLFIKNIPHGFYEDQLKAYFGQFGSVTRARVALSERTGKSKGYAFVEFRVPEVAKIAAETMDNYLMFKQVLKTAYIPPEEQKYNYFRQTVHIETQPDGTKRLVTPYTQRVAKALKKINTMPTKKQHDNRVERSLHKLKKAQEKFGIDLQHIVHGKAEDETGAPPKLTKKQQKVAAAAKRADAAARKSAAADKKKSVDANSTLDKLLNETIGDDEDDSDDEDFNGSALLAAKLKAIDANTTLEKLLNDTISDGDDSDDADFSAGESDEDEPPSKKAKRASAVANRTLDQLINDTIGESDDDDTDEDFDGSALASEADLTISTLDDSEVEPSPVKKPKRNAAKKQKLQSSDSSASSSSPEQAKIVRPAKGKGGKQAKGKTGKANVSDTSVDSSPEPVRPTKAGKNSKLLSTAGIQKKPKNKGKSSVSQAVKNPKQAKNLIEASAGAVKNVTGKHLKKSKKA